MGSSKKHKERREKKKHKRGRSRSRSHEKESRRRSGKSKKDHDRRKEYYDDTKRSNNYSDEERCFEDKLSKVSAALQGSDDDFDIEQLLDSKLKTEKTSHVEKSPTVESGKKRKRPVEHDDNSQDVSSYKREKLDAFSQEGDAQQDQYQGRSMRDQAAGSSVDQGGNAFPKTESGQVQLSLSISDANKLRAKLGLKPLDVTVEIPGLGNDSEEQFVDSSKKEVFVKTENIAEIKKTEKIKEKLKTAKEKRKIAQKLSIVKPLAASDSDEESTATWIQKSRKLQIEKEQADRQAKLLEEMDAEFGVSALVEEQFEKNKKKSYSSKDLKGMVVAHDSSMLKEGQKIILTLKDKGVLDEDDDVLQNVNLLDEEHYAKNIANKKKKKDYTPYEEEFDEFGILKKKNMLSKYDEEIHGESKKSFVLGSVTDKEKEIEMIRMKLRQQQGVTLEMSNMKVASEYFTPGEMVQFKKPKKKKLRKKPAMLKADDLLGAFREDSNSHPESRNNDEDDVKNSNTWEPAYQTRDDTMMKDPDEDDGDFLANEDLSKVVIDEDQAERELHSALHKARRLKQRKSLFAPEKLASELIKLESMDTDADDATAGPIVLNSTAEFCRTLGDIPTYGLSGNRDEEADELLDFERELMEERQRQELEAQNRGAWNEVNMDETPGEITMRENEPILEEEPDITIGVASALMLAQKKGYLDKETKKLMTGPRASQLQAKSYTIEEKFYEDDKFGKRERFSGPIQDFREKSSYNPEVKLEYIDDSGRLLNSKEAFRYLSHKFHGKGPGKNKVDKRMKKLDQDTKLKQMSSTDTPLNTVKLLQAKQKETQSPYIVLSGGSKTLTQTMISKPKYT